MTSKPVTTSPVEPGDFTNTNSEFGRVADVTRLFGLRRGTLYALLRCGKVRGVLLRVQGGKSGVRLFDIASVREFIRAEMDRAEEGGIR
jgi:hypothetical protein